MADREYRSGDLRECAGDVRGVDGQPAQRVDQRLHLDTGGQQQFGDGGETAGVGERAVHERDSWRFRVVLGHVRFLFLGGGGMGSAGEEAEQVFVEFLLVRAGQPVRCARVDLEDRVRHDLGGLEGRGTDVQRSSDLSLNPWTS